MTRRWMLLLLSCPGFWGCEAAVDNLSDAAEMRHPDGGALDAGVLDGGPDPSEVLFDVRRLLKVELEMAPADWDALRLQTRDPLGVLVGSSCLAEPFGSPFTYFPAKVTVDGISFEPVGVRKKGFLGSLSEEKPSLKISLDEYVPGQQLLGLDGLTLNNNRQDASQIKACLGYEVMARAGVPVPRCSQAEVWLNGRLLGAYTHVEAVKKRFLRRAFGSDQGHLYEGTVSDFREGWLGSFDQKIDETVPYDRSELAFVAEALLRSDTELPAALEPLVDVEAFLSFWAGEALIEHWDGYAGNRNNFFAYFEPGGGKLRFVPWGVDGILGARRDPNLPISVMANGALAHRLYQHPDYHARYVARLAEHLDQAWDAAGLLTTIDQRAALVSRVLSSRERTAAAAATTALKTFVRGREAELRANLGAAWDQELGKPPCFADIGRVHAELETRWGTHPTNNPAATGTGVLTGTIAGQVLESVQVGSAAGFGQGPDDTGQAVFLLAAVQPDGALEVVYVVVDPRWIAPGVTVPFDFETIRGALLRIPRANAPAEVLGFFVEGTVRFQAASLTDGAEVSVSVDSRVLQPL